MRGAHGCPRTSPPTRSRPEAARRARTQPAEPVRQSARESWWKRLGHGCARPMSFGAPSALTARTSLRAEQWVWLSAVGARPCGGAHLPPSHGERAREGRTAHEGVAAFETDFRAACSERRTRPRRPGPCCPCENPMEKPADIENTGNRVRTKPGETRPNWPRNWRRKNSFKTEPLAKQLRRAAFLPE